MSINNYCASFAAVLLLFCCERDCMIFLSKEKQADVIEVLNLRSR